MKCYVPFRMAISPGERLKRKREAERKRRKRIQESPGRREEENRKRRERKARKKVERKKFKESAKQIRDRREKWKAAKRRYREKKSRLAAESALETVSSRADSIRKKAKRRAESRRVKHYYLLKKIENRARNAERRANKYKLRCFRLQEKHSKNSTSPASALKREMKSRKEKVSPTVARKLLFGSAMMSDIRESLSKIRSTRAQKAVSSSISFKYVQKYRLQRLAKPVFRFRSFLRKKEMSLREKRVEKRRKIVLNIENYVRQFFEDDDVSSLTPSKNDRIVKHKVKKQKRFLLNSLKYLFKVFQERSPFTSISYARFCKLRPFWVVQRPVGSRDTCLCVKCANARLICECLQRLHVINNRNLDVLFENELCCNPITEECRFRICIHCREKNIEIREFDGTEECHYESWQTNVEVGRDNKEHRRTAKQKIYCLLHDLVVIFLDPIFPAYVKHKANDWHQKKEIKNLKRKLTLEDLLLHVDFAENYSCKYQSEIQSIHFGGNRDQVSLHTGVLYNASMLQSFCTVTSDLNHNAFTIYCHLEPILEEFRHKIRHLHFLSDSPVTQYRNRYMFYIIIRKIIPLFPDLETLSWNFSEAGHGKGAPDGVGATLKRTCDRLVATSGDVSNFEEFVQCVSDNVQNIKILVVKPTTDQLEEEVKKFSKPVRGT